MDHPARHPKYRTKLCRNYMSGKCAFGTKCCFIHPPLGLFPPYHSSSPLARQLLFNWNVLFPRMMAFSQAIPSVHAPSPTPQSQGPSLVYEDPSPPSLLLSATGAVTSGSVEEAKSRSLKLKEIPCKHFVRTGGWCPAGGECKFTHDYSVVQYSTPQSTAVSLNDRAMSLPTDMYNEDSRATSGDIPMGVLPLSRNTGQEPLSEAHSQYTHAQEVEPYPEHYTPSLYWPWQSYPNYPQYYTPKYPSPIPIAATAPQAVVLPQSNGYSPEPETAPILPTGSYEMNGTTYFPPPQLFAPYPVSYNRAPLAPSLYYDQSPNYIPPCNSGTELWHPNEVSPPPASPPYFLGIASSPTNVAPSGLNMASSGIEGDRLTTTQENEFPYRPPKNQQVGHARRISVNIKRHADRS